MEPTRRELPAQHSASSSRTTARRPVECLDAAGRSQDHDAVNGRRDDGAPSPRGVSGSPTWSHQSANDAASIALAPATIAAGGTISARMKPHSNRVFMNAGNIRYSSVPRGSAGCATPQPSVPSTAGVHAGVPSSARSFSVLPPALIARAMNDLLPSCDACDLDLLVCKEREVVHADVHRGRHAR